MLNFKFLLTYPCRIEPKLSTLSRLDVPETCLRVDRPCECVVEVCVDDADASWCVGTGFVELRARDHVAQGHVLGGNVAKEVVL